MIILGRLHPLVVHLPIGFIAALAILEGAALWQMRRKGHATIAVPPLLVLLVAVSTSIAAATGHLLAGEPGYESAAVDRHRHFGVALAIFAFLMWLFHVSRIRFGYLALLGVVCGLVAITGHLGGSMTHGEDFLTFSLPEKKSNQESASRETSESSTTQAPSPIAADMFAEKIRPIFDRACVQCHGEAKKKGGLALHDRASIEKGGDTGPMFVVGKPGESDIVRRLNLPEDEDEHMPPRGKPQLTADEKKAIVDWIAAGAPISAKAAVAAEEKPAVVEPNVAANAPPKKIEPDPAAIERLRAAFIHVERTAADSPLLSIDTTAVAKKIGNADIETFAKDLGPYIASLSLAGTLIDDDALKTIASLPSLVRLDVRGTAIGNIGIGRLFDGQSPIEELNLVKTKVDDDGLAALLGLPRLSKVHLWKSGVTKAGADNLRKSREGLRVETGDFGDSAVLEAEKDVVFTNTAPPPGISPDVAAALKPKNTICPISGTAVDLRYVAVYRGQAIGFCCPKCAEKFWADPQKYADKLK